MPRDPSRITTHGRTTAGGRGLWQATGMSERDRNKPIIAINLGDMTRIEDPDVQECSCFGPGGGCGGPGMQDMLYPTIYRKSKRLGNASALVTVGRFCDAASGLSVEPISPAAQDEKGRKPAKPRPRNVTAVLRAYAALTRSAAMGAVRKFPEGW